MSIGKFRLNRPSRSDAMVRHGVAVSISLLFAVSDANAADQGVTGKKLLLKSAPTLMLISKDPSINIAGSDPIGGADSSVSFDVGSGPVSFNLPKALWSTNASGTLFKYKNADAPAGPSVVKVAKIKPGLLKLVAKGLPFAVPNGSATIDVVLSLDGGTNTYCMTFTGIGNGQKFLVKDAAAGSCTGPPDASPTPTLTAAATNTPTRTPTNTPPIVACGSSPFPICGGSCPVGQVCQAVLDVQCICGSSGCQPISDGCMCVPAGGTCSGCQGTQLTCGITCNTPLTFGPCPVGQACGTASVGSFVVETVTRGCLSEIP